MVPRSCSLSWTCGCFLLGTDPFPDGPMIEIGSDGFPICKDLLFQQCATMPLPSSPKQRRGGHLYTTCSICGLKLPPPDVEGEIVCQCSIVPMPSSSSS